MQVKYLYVSNKFDIINHIGPNNLSQRNFNFSEDNYNDILLTFKLSRLLLEERII
jgi:hypothetical protein